MATGAGRGGAIQAWFASRFAGGTGISGRTGVSVDSSAGAEPASSGIRVLDSPAGCGNRITLPGVTLGECSALCNAAFGDRSVGRSQSSAPAASNGNDPWKFLRSRNRPTRWRTSPRQSGSAGAAVVCPAGGIQAQSAARFAAVSTDSSGGGTAAGTTGNSRGFSAVAGDAVRRKLSEAPNRAGPAPSRRNPPPDSRAGT